MTTKEIMAARLDAAYQIGEKWLAQRRVEYSECERAALALMGRRCGNDVIEDIILIWTQHGVHIKLGNEEFDVAEFDATADEWTSALRKICCAN